MNIHQTPKAISLGDRIFPAQFLLEREFPPLPGGITSRRYEPDKKLFCQSDGKTQMSAGSLPWGEGDKFLKTKEFLWEEYQKSLKSPELQAETEAIPAVTIDPAQFASNCLSSQLYQIAKTSPDPIVQREKSEVQAIINGMLMFAPITIAPGGVLQKNLNELMTALGDVSPDAISEFNQLLADDLGVEWRL
ncbi:MAG: hypothetical protein AAGA60_07645 [Cyanobacteria bacterium P01_E01_bin.42]